jgi:hypothetical protein
VSCARIISTSSIARRSARSWRSSVAQVTVVANLTFGGMSRVAVPALADRDFSAGAVGLGALVATFTAGCLVGGLVAAGLTGVTRRGATAMSSGVVMALSVLAVPLAGIAGHSCSCSSPAPPARSPTS